MTKIGVKAAACAEPRFRPAAYGEPEITRPAAGGPMLLLVIAALAVAWVAASVVPMRDPVEMRRWHRVVRASARWRAEQFCEPTAAAGWCRAIEHVDPR